MFTFIYIQLNPYNIGKAVRGTAYNMTKTKFQPNEDIKVDTDTVRAGSPLNYVREKNKQRFGTNKGASKA